LDNISKSAIRNTAFEELNQITWQPKSSPNNEVKSEFSKLNSSSGKSQRVKDMSLKLFQANIYQSI
jgi:hypothetical protein